MTLKKLTFSAVRWTSIAVIGKVGFHFLQIVILARILPPADIGLMALVLTVIMFALLFIDMGISSAIIHYQNISDHERSSLYWLNVSTGIVIVFLLIFISHLVSDFYHEPRLRALLILISPYFFIVALGQQLKVLAEKELQFKILAINEFVAATIGFIIMVILALGGVGVYALVIGFLANATAFTAISWINLSHGWRPYFRLHFSEVKKFLSFGFFMIANNLINSINSSADIFLGGRILGASQLGIYSLPRDLALNIASVINPIVTRVGLPVMAKSQGNQLLLKSVYLKTMRMTSSINFPIYMALFAFAPEVVSILFGSKWHESSPLLRLLAFWGMLRSIGNPVGSLLFALGRADIAFKWNLVWMLIMLPSFWLGLQYGTFGLSIALLILGIIVQIPNWYFLVRPLCGASIVEYFAQIAHPFLASLFATLIGFASVMGIERYWLRLILGVSVESVTYIAISYWLNRTWLITLSELLMMPKSEATVKK